MNICFRNTLFGGGVALLSTLALYHFFFKDYFKLMAGEVDYIEYRTRVYILPVFIVFGLGVLVFQPKQNTWVPWHEQDDTAKMFTKIMLTLGILASAGLYGLILFTLDDGTVPYQQEQIKATGVVNLDNQEADLIVSEIKEILISRDLEEVVVEELVLDFKDQCSSVGQGALVCLESIKNGLLNDI